jgi:nucleoside-diphosphate-sugar epimerase
VSRWAITGGSGFLGLHLVGRLLSRGGTVRTLDLEPQTLPVESIVGDVRRADDAGRLVHGADVLVHAAAALPIRGSRRALRSVNVEGTRMLLEAAADAGVRRAILVSSAVVYGVQAGPLREDTRPAPIEPYGLTKVEAERLWLSLGARGPETVILRPTAFVGPGRLGVFGILFDWIRENRRIYTLGPGTNRYALLAVEDLVEAVLLAAERPVAGETFNLGATRFGTVVEVLRELIARAGSTSRVVALPAEPMRTVLAGLAVARLSPLSRWHYESADKDFVLDVSKAERELGWAPRSSNVEALERAYRWYVANRGRLGGQRDRSHVTPWRERALALARRLS